MGWVTSMCAEGAHEWCGNPRDCTCSCHGDEPPAGVREPRSPSDPAPTLTSHVG